MMEVETSSTPMNPDLLQPNSRVRGLTKGPSTCQKAICRLNIQAVVVEDVPRSSRKREKRMPKHTGSEKMSVYWESEKEELGNL